MSPRSKRPRKPMNPVPIEERKRPVTIDSPAPAAAKGGRNKALIPIAIGATAAAAGGGYLIHRSRQKKKETTMSKNLINPFEDVVVFGKAYKVALPVPGAKRIGALVHTGKHVGHGQKLTHVRNGKGGGGRATRLERYVGKAAGFGGAASRQFPGNVRKPSVKNGLRMISEMPKAKGVPGNSNVPAGAKPGRRLVRV